MTPAQRPQNWVFLGDSLTEGVGSARVSYVTELVTLLRKAEKQKPEHLRRAVHEFRLRQVNVDSFDRFVRFNTAGLLKTDQPAGQPALWLWNFACEGRTIEGDLEWLPLIANLHPERVFILRGALENIVRPAGLRDGTWPWWVPGSWRGYAAMDPRCYFSTTWWRRLKQQAVDALKQQARLALLRQRPGATLMREEEWLEHYRGLLDQLRPLAERIHLLGLLPIDERQFPGSLASFRRAGDLIRDLAHAHGLDFVAWHAGFAEAMRSRKLLYLDGFHPNQLGAGVLADILKEELSATRT